MWWNDSVTINHSLSTLPNCMTGQTVFVGPSSITKNRKSERKWLLFSDNQFYWFVTDESFCPVFSYSSDVIFSWFFPVNCPDVNKSGRPFLSKSAGIVCDITVFKEEQWNKCILWTRHARGLGFSKSCGIHHTSNWSRITTWKHSTAYLQSDWENID